MSLITKSTYLRGPKGDIGLQGPRGDRGLAGAQGPQGVQGPDSDPQYIREQFAATGNITYNSNTGVIGFTNPGYATTTYVDTVISNLVAGAPDLLNTLNELATAIGNNASFIDSVVLKTGSTMTGALILNANPSADLEAATKQYVDNATMGVTVYSTDDVPEGNDNLYYSDARSRSSISATGNLNYNSVTGVMSYTEPGRTIDDLTDVDTSTNTPQDKQSLVWNESNSNWVPGNPAVTITIYNYDAIDGQLRFNGQDQNQQSLSYTEYDLVQVFKNGILLRKNIQYTLNDDGYIDYVATGDSVDLILPAQLNDWIYITVTNTTGSQSDITITGGGYEDSGDVIDYGTY